MLILCRLDLDLNGLNMNLNVRGLYGTIQLNIASWFYSWLYNVELWTAWSNLIVTPPEVWELLLAHDQDQ